MIVQYFSLVVMTLMGSVASLYLKKASGSENLISLLKSPFIYIGGFLYFVSSIINIIVLRYLDYSVVLPLTSLTYIWTMLLSYLFLKEKITSRKMIGLVLILMGAVCVSAAFP